MPRKPVLDIPMAPVERRRRSDAAKVDRGEMRITTWISPEAAKALNKIMKREGCSIQTALNDALRHYIK